MIYLDNAATTKISDKTLEIMFETSKNIYGNPSSTHHMGQKAKGLITKSRNDIAKILNINPSEIIFTSGGTEGNNLIIKGYLEEINALRTGKKHIITSKIEHSSVINVFKKLENDGYDVTYLNVDKKGVVDLNQLKEILRTKENRAKIGLISIMYVNNETGVIQPIQEIAKLLQDYSINENEEKIFFHSDMVQAISKLEIDYSNLDVDAFTASSHKFHGPKGVGFVYLNNKYNIKSQINGGHHERNRRAGTENLIGIAGMREALLENYETISKNIEHEKELLNRLEEKLIKEIEGITINCSESERTANITSVTIKGTDIQTLLASLDLNGVCVSGGSACMSGAYSKSHVLEAMGFDDQKLSSTIRISISRYTTKEEIDEFVEILKKVISFERV